MTSLSSSTESVFRSIPTPDRLFIPAPAGGRNRPLISKPIGTVVEAGEQLTLDQTETDAVPLAPVAGTIIGDGRAPLFNGNTVDCIKLKPTTPGLTPTTTPPAFCNLRSILRFTDLGPKIDHFLKAGISAFRTCSPDFLGQLYQCLTRPIDTVLCCVLDSDPNLPLNTAIAETYPAELAAGIDMLAKLTGALRVWVVADPNVPNHWFRSLDPLVIADGLRLAALPSDYPQPHPTILLHTLLERRLRPGRLPVEQGVLLFDAFAAVAVGRCALYEQSMLTVPIGVRDHVRRKTHFLSVPIGTTADDICKSLDIPAAEVRLRCGDFLRDQIIPSTAVVGPAELILHIASREISWNPDPCIRCGWCYEACPTRVQPAGLLESAQRNDLRMAERFGLDACIECGICSFVCPSRLPLLAAIRKLKALENSPA